MAKETIGNPNDGFNWDLYEDGYTGGSHLVINKKVKTTSKKDKVYCHEAYAQELYDMMEEYQRTHKITSKDVLPGNTYEICGIKPISKNEISVDTTAGMSAVIDLNKDRQYLDALGCTSPAQLTNALRNDAEFKKNFLASGIIAKVNNLGRISLWEGHRAKLEEEFKKQITEPTAAYEGTVVASNNGGYIVDVCGIQCFMPGSLAAPGVLADFTKLIGKKLPVMIINYLPKTGSFVVSYKKYLNTILPSKIENELEVGMTVMCKMTGASTNAVFVQFKDKDGEWIFSGLIHRSMMSHDFEEDFNNNQFVNGDEFRLIISSINYADGKYRIVLTDDPARVKTEKEENKDEESKED